MFTVHNPKGPRIDLPVMHDRIVIEPGETSKVLSDEKVNILLSRYPWLQKIQVETPEESTEENDLGDDESGEKGAEDERVYELDDLDFNELRATAKEKGLKADGSADDLKSRIREFDAGEGGAKGGEEAGESDDAGDVTPEGTDEGGEGAEGGEEVDNKE